MKPGGGEEGGSGGRRRAHTAPVGWMRSWSRRLGGADAAEAAEADVVSLTGRLDAKAVLRRAPQFPPPSFRNCATCRRNRACALSNS